MTEQWKPIGDKWPQPAMVMVRDATNGGHCNILLGDRGASDWIPRTALRPMPPAITPEQQAVLDAAVSQERAALTIGNDPPGFYSSTIRATNNAVRAMLAAQQPPDPVTELREARNEEQGALLKYLREAESGMGMARTGLLRDYDHASKRVEAAIAALEAKS